MHVQTLLAAAAATSTIITATMASPDSQRFAKRYGSSALTKRYTETDSFAYAGTDVEAEDPPDLFITVIGTFVVPTCTAGDTSDSSVTSWEATFWPGLQDGDAAASLMQAGVLCVVTTGADTRYAAFVEYAPAALIEFPNFSVNAGDTVTVQIVRLTTTEFEAIITDTTQNTETTTTLSAPAPSNTVLGTNAYWIVEALTSGNGNIVPLANFGSIDWTDSSADNADGNVQGAVEEPFEVFFMLDSAGNDLTAFSAGTSADDDAFTISWVGPGSSQ